MTNAELLNQAGKALGAMGVQKADTVMTTASMKAGEFMDRKAVERLVDLTVSQSAWLSALSVRLRNQRSGEMPRVELSEVVTEGVPENGGKTVASHPTTDFVPYSCGKYQATWYFTVEDLREARASGEPDFERKIRAAFAKAMGNDMARWYVNGDTGLDASTRVNRLLRKRDGVLKQARTKAIRSTTGRGAPFQRDLFTAMHSAMPEVYRDDADLRWFMPSILDIAWTDSLRDPTTAQGSALGDRATLERRRFEPHGIPQLIVPQMPTGQGFSTVTGATAAADAITNNGPNVNLTAQLDTFFGGYDAKWAGRRVKITLTATGESEIATVVDTGAQLQITTAGSLGQAVISTTAGDYSLDLADLTSAWLTNPRNMFLVLCDQIRAYRRFEQEYERWRIDVFYEADAGIFNENAFVLQDGIASPAFTFGQGW